jgi:hypothetical protein
MTSQRRVEANRKNAQKSTGPRTKSGKARARINARSHGLTIPVVRDTQLADEIDALALYLCQGDETLLNLARHVAEAQYDILRIRNLRFDIFSFPEIIKGRISKRRQNRFLSLRCRVIRPISQIMFKRLAEEQKDFMINSRLQIDRALVLEEFIALELSAEILRVQRLRRLERYEQRAFLRRRRVLRDFYKEKQERGEPRSFNLIGSVQPVS